VPADCFIFVCNYPSLEFLHACVWELGDHATLGASMLTDILPLHAASAYVPCTVNLMVVRLRKESQVWCPKYHPESMFTLRTPCRLESTNTTTHHSAASPSHRLCLLQKSTLKSGGNGVGHGVDESHHGGTGNSTDSPATREGEHLLSAHWRMN
jgi:hypothetical protein